MNDEGTEHLRGWVRQEDLEDENNEYQEAFVQRCQAKHDKLINAEKRKRVAQQNEPNKRLKPTIQPQRPPSIAKTQPARYFTHVWLTT